MLRPSCTLESISRPTARDDRGFGLIEVIVAMVVFGVIATGVVSAIGITLRMTPDNEARETAANLAAQEIDIVRAAGDPYEISPRTVTQTINGRTYTTTRTKAWVQPNGISGTCGASNANFELRVHVDVSWTGQNATTGNVKSDTLMAPLSTVTTGSTGALAITVQDGGNGNAAVSGAVLNVVPSATNPNGAVAPAAQPAATGTDGCSYLGRLHPGNYDVSATVAGSGRTTQQTQPVIGGGTTPVPITITGVGTLARDLADNQGPDAVLPTDLVVSYLNGTDLVYVNSSPSFSAKADAGGYMAVAGRLGSPVDHTVTCPEFDPSQWAAGQTNGRQMAAGVREAKKALVAGGTATPGVPMGTVALANVKDLWIKAVQVAPSGNGNPGCTASATTLHFPRATVDDPVLALPYGSWVLYTGPLSGLETIPVLGPQITDTSNAAGAGVSLLGTVTLDPRALK